MPEDLKPELADPGAKVRSMKVTLKQMSDLRLTVLLVSLCKEEGVGTSQAFHRPFSFQVIMLFGRTQKEAGGGSLCSSVSPRQKA